MSVLTAQDLNYRDVLQWLAAREVPATHIEVATATGRDKSNTRRDLLKLADADRVAESGDGWILSATGREVCAAFARLDGDGPMAAAPAVWPLDAIDLNPDNVRKTIDEDSIAGLAESIVGAQGLLQPIVLYPIGADGRRLLHAGERRVRACRLLAQQDRLPESLAQGLPFSEREGTAVEALFVALVENAQREDVSPWEDAKGLKAYKDASGLSARALAFKLGRAREGSEEGVRDVQEKIRTVERAAPDQVAQVEAGHWSFDQLKRMIRKPAAEVAEQLRPIDLMVIAEVLHRGKAHPKNRHYGLDTECSYTAGADPVLKGLVSQRILRFTEQSYEDHKASVCPGYSGEVLGSEELAPLYHSAKGEKAARDSIALLHDLRVAAVGQAAAEEARTKGIYVTAWLNGPFELSAKAQAKVEAAKATKAELKDANKKVRELREKRLKDARAIEADLRKLAPNCDWDTTLFEGAMSLRAQLAAVKVLAPFQADRGFLVSANGEGICDLNWRFQEDKPLVAELLATALNLAFGFPAHEADFLRKITGRLQLLGFEPQIAEARAPRALARGLELLGREFGDPTTPWTDTVAAGIADGWFEAWGFGLPEDEYLGWVADRLWEQGFDHSRANELAAGILNEELQVHGIAFGDENYDWSKADARRLADDFFAVLPDDQRPLPLETAIRKEEETHVLA